MIILEIVFHTALMPQPVIMLFNMEIGMLKPGVYFDRRWLYFNLLLFNIKMVVLQGPNKTDYGDDYCSVSRWRPQKVDKRMVLEHTHGLFIT
jgi:hypothetical protein